MLEDDVIKKEESEYTDDLEGGFEYEDLTKRTHRRRGGAFDMLARVLRGVKRVIFGSGMIMENRPGMKSRSASSLDFWIPSENVLEIYAPKKPNKGKYNTIFIGRDGKSEANNVNNIDLHVTNADNDKVIGNGRLSLTLKDKESGAAGTIGLYHTKTTPSYLVVDGKIDRSQLAETTSGIRIELTGTEIEKTSGDIIGGGVQLGFMDKDGNFLSYFVLDGDGIQMAGLPTTQPETPYTLWNDNGTLKIT